MRQNLFFIVIILMLAILIFFAVGLPARIADFRYPVSSWADQKQMEYANKLLSKGLKEQAAEAYEEYFAIAKLKPREEAKLWYKLGSIYMEIFKYEKALVAFYKAEILNPHGEFIGEMNQKIIEALESLGMSTQARYELEARSTLGVQKETTGKVLARIGNKEITDFDIDQALKGASEWVRKSFLDPQKRQQFIQDYVAREVLYGRAKRLGLDTNEDIRQILEQLKKQIAVEQLLSKEIKGQLDKVSEQDLKLYYDAHKEDYTEQKKDKKDKRQKSFEEVRSEVDSAYRMKKQQEITQAMLKQALEEQEVEIFFTTDKNDVKKTN